jgi:hypothetical protein
MPQERRTNGDGKPPTALMQSYKAMAAQQRKELKRIGYGALVFCLVVPVLASIAMRTFAGVGLPAVAWLFCGVGVVVGVCLSWPEMGLHLLSMLPNAVAKLLPGKLADRAIVTRERRGED